MKKHQLFFAANLLSLVAVYVLFSSFTYLSNHQTAVESQQSFWTALQGFSIEKLSFWQKSALFLGASSGGYALFSRHYRRHYGAGIGCLGVFGFIILGVLVLALLPLILVIGLVMLIVEAPFPHFGGRGRHRRHYR